MFDASIVGITRATIFDWHGCEKVMVCDCAGYLLANARHFGFAIYNLATENVQDKGFATFGIRSG